MASDVLGPAWAELWQAYPQMVILRCQVQKLFHVITCVQEYHWEYRVTLNVSYISLYYNKKHDNLILGTHQLA
jgi:hypothetical protein